MGEFMRRKEGRETSGSGRFSGSVRLRLLSAVFFLALVFWGGSNLLAAEKRTVAVLPFRIHSLQPMEHLKLQLQEMLFSQMQKEGLQVVSLTEINNHPIARLPILELKDALALGKDVNADFVIFGSLTQVGRKVSLDIKAADVKSLRPPFSLFVVEDDTERLADAVDRASQSLSNQIGGFIQVDSVLVKGCKRIEAEAVLAVVESKKGEKLDQEKLDKDLKSVYGMGFFKDVTMEVEEGANGKIVIINVNEKPSISKISFDGNKKMSEEDLKKESGIKLYSILNQSEIKQSINRLNEYYKVKGFYNVEIKDDVKELPNNEVTLVYKIEEGKKLLITNIEFTGVTKFKPKELKKLMEISEKQFFLWAWITKAGLLDKNKLELDCQKVAAFYHNHGYIKARTGEPKIDVGENGITITIEVTEGAQYAVNNVKITGDLVKPEDVLLKKVKINKEKYFNREVVRKDLLTLRDLYADEGYAYSEVVPVVREDDKATTVDITYQVAQNKKVRFERINILGNTVTRDKVIRRELKAVEGEYFSGTDMKRSTQNLNRLGFFEDVDIQTKKGSQDDLMALDVVVKERPTGNFSLGAGYSSFDKAIGMFSISQNNLFGRGQKLGASASVGSRTQEIDVKFSEPWLMDRPVGMDVDLYKFDREYYEFTKDSYGGALQFAFPVGLDEFTRGIIGYGYDDARVKDVADTASLVIKDMIGKNTTSSATFGIRHNSKDKPWDTREGSYNSLTYEYAGSPLGGNVGFDRYQATSAWYWPMPWNTAFMTQGRWGYVVQKDGEKLPVYQKYRLGGINTIRGFDDYTVSPKDPLTGDNIGGEKMLIFNFEYRFPLLKEQGISGILFFDAGNSWSKEEQWTVTDLKKSVGTGIRWYSPVGPLRLEYGWVLGREKNEPSGNWAFSVGGLF